MPAELTVNGHSTVLATQSADELLEVLACVTGQCHQALREKDYALAYQRLLHREPVLRELIERKIQLGSIWKDLQKEESKQFLALKQAMADRNEKINIIRQSKARNAQYKTRPARSSGVTRGYA